MHLNGEAARETLVVTEHTRRSSSRPRRPTSPSTSRSTSPALEAGTQILASDLALPAGSVLLLDPETLIVNITQAQTAEELEAELEEAEAEAGIERDESDEEPAEGDEAAEGESAAESAEGGDGE